MDVASIHELFAYDRWANARALDAAAGVPEDLLTKPLGSSHPSLFDTLKHILWGEWRWLCRWQDPALCGSDPLPIVTFGELRRHWTHLEESLQGFLSTLDDAALARVVSYDNPPGTSWSYTLDHMLRHVVNHSTYHRGQAATLLRQLGAQAPSTDFLVYVDERDAPPGG